MTGPAALAGWRVLVPRDGQWGEQVAAALTAAGAEPVVAPLIAIRPPDDATSGISLDRLTEGAFDWLVVTSAATVRRLVALRVGIAPATRVAAVGPATAAALEAADVRVDFVPSREHSARGLVAEWPHAAAARVLVLQSDLAGPDLAEGLRALGNDVETAVVYRTESVPLDADVLGALGTGGIQAVLLTSGSAARSLAAQLDGVPHGLTIACLGPLTAAETRAVGLAVDVVAPERSGTALVAALAEFALAGNAERGAR